MSFWCPKCVEPLFLSRWYRFEWNFWQFCVQLRFFVILTLFDGKNVLCARCVWMTDGNFLWRQWLIDGLSVGWCLKWKIGILEVVSRIFSRIFLASIWNEIIWSWTARNSSKTHEKWFKEAYPGIFNKTLSVWFELSI